MKSKRNNTYSLVRRLNSLLTKQNNLPNEISRLERMGIWVTIFGTIFSLVGTIISIYLAVKISGQQTEIKNLNEVIGELKQQNKISKDEMNEISKQTLFLQNQALSSKRNYEIAYDQFEQNQSDKNISESINIKEVEEIWIELSNFRFQLYNYDSFQFVNSLSNNQQLDFFVAVNEVIKKGLRNSYVVKDEKIYSYWYVFSNQLKSTHDWFLPSNGNYSINGRGVSRMQSLEGDFNNFKRYFENFFKKGVEPLLETKVFKDYRHKHLKEANFGRPDQK